MTRNAVFIAILAARLGGVAAFDTGLDRRAIEEALSIGQSAVESVRTRFHRPYRMVASVAPLDFVDVVTPFRKIVLAAEAQARAGSRRFSLRKAQETLASSPELTLHIELTFHPFNTFIGVPAYDVVLIDGRQSVAPATVDRIPRFGPRVEGAPLREVPTAGALLTQKNSQPMTGGTLIAKFPTTQLKPTGAYEARVMDGAKELAKVRIDFGRLR